MKKDAFPRPLPLLLALLLASHPACRRAWAEDDRAASGEAWKLPVCTLGYGVSAGSGEDDEEDIQVPSSLRHTVTLRLREELGRPLLLTCLLKYSRKDYYAQAGDAVTLSVDQDGRLRLSDLLDLGAGLSARWVSRTDLAAGDAPNDVLTLKGNGNAAWKPGRGTSIDGSLQGGFDLASRAAKGRQVWTAGLGFESRLGDFLLRARYRGELRFPLGVESAVEDSGLHTGTFSLQWDPNRP